MDSLFDGKVCTRCGLWRRLSEFSKNRRTADGLFRSCKICEHQYYLVNQEKVKERVRKWEADNPERRREGAKRYRERHAEELRQRANEKYKYLSVADRERRNATRQAWRQRVREQREAEHQAQQAQRAAEIAAALGGVPGKACRECGELKPLTEFWKAAHSPDSLQYKCKVCLRAYHAANIDHIKAEQRKRYKSDPEQYKERAKAWRAANPERKHQTAHTLYLRRRQLKGRRFAVIDGSQKLCLRCDMWKPLDEFPKNTQNKSGLSSRCKACYQSYHWTNRARILRENHRRYWEDPEKYRAQKRNWAAANPEQSKEAKRRDYRKHRARCYAASHKRRARLLGNGGFHTAEEWQAMCDWFGNICLCCGAAGPLDRDHVVPVSKGGTNDITNIQPLCDPCNTRKNNYHSTDYRDPDKLAAFLASLGR